MIFKTAHLFFAIMLLLVACGNESSAELEQHSKLEEFIPQDNETDVIIIENTSEETDTSSTVKIIAVNNMGKEIIIDSIKKSSITVELPTSESATVQEAVFTEEFRPDHTQWDQLTKKRVSSTGKVDYVGMKAEIDKLTSYLNHLATTPPTNEWTKNEKLAYWINLYNASTVYLIVSNYPVSSITKINGGKPWDKKFIKSGTKTYSLNEIENNIVRPQFKDPRIHAALNCAAKSCPNLLQGAYLSKSLNKQLDKQVFSWINDPSKNKLSGNKAQVSQLFDWYKADFKDGVIPFINNYIMTSIALEPKAKITYLEYDWALNE